MSQVDELLNTMSEEGGVMYTARPESEPHIVIGEDRYITVPAELKRIGVQGDHNIETVTFDCPRYWDEHDMSMMDISINYLRPDGRAGMFPAINVTVDDSDTSIMHFDWVISKHVTEIKGNLSILICIKKLDEDNNDILHWNSEINNELTISEGIEAGEAIIRIYPDILTQWRDEIFLMADDATNEILAAKNRGDFDGGTFVPHIDENGVLSWTNNRGAENPEPRSVIGKTGVGIVVSDSEPTDGPVLWFDITNDANLADALQDVIDKQESFIGGDA